MTDISVTHAKALYSLVGSNFGELSEAENKLLNSASSGKPAYCGPNEDDTNPNNDPAVAAQWDVKRQIRSELLRWLCVCGEASAYVDRRGISIHAGMIVGELDLSFADVPFPITFWRCAITDNIYLTHATIPALNFTHTYIRSFHADNVNVAGSVMMRDGFVAKGRVELRDAQIGGTLLCDRATFENPGKMALVADRAVIKGSVLLKDNFRAEGEVRLLGAQIGSNLECDGSKFNNSCSGTQSNPASAALNADRVQVTGGIFLRSGFSAQGVVRFLGAQVGGDFDCSGSVFKNKEGKSIAAENIKVGGNIFLRGDFVSEGTVVLFRAQLGGGIDCRGGTFKNPTGCVLNADETKIGGAIFLRELSADGQIRLSSAQIDGDLDFSESKLRSSENITIIAESCRINGDVRFRDTVCDGEAKLEGIQLSGDLDCSRAMFKKHSLYAIDARRIKVGGSVYFDWNFSADGEVQLSGAQIAGNVHCNNGHFRNSDGTALTAEESLVQGSVFMRAGFSAEGGVTLRGSQISGNLICRDAIFSTLNLDTAAIRGVFFWSGIPNPSYLDLSNASAEAIVDDESSWPPKGKLKMNGFSYTRIDGGPTDVKARIEWLNRLDHFTPQPYHQVAKVLLESGDELGARRLLFACESQRRKKPGRHWFWRCFDWVLKVSIGYGYRTEWALGWLALLTAIGCIFSGIGYVNGALIPTDKEAYLVFEQTGCPPPYYPSFNPLFFSFETSIPLKVGVRDHWHPNTENTGTLPPIQWKVFQELRDFSARGIRAVGLSTAGILGLWIFCQSVVGWMLVALFGIGFVGIVKGTT